MEQHVAAAFVLTTLAGLSTGIGSALGVFAGRTNKGFLSFALGFSAGVMIYVSFVELFGHAGQSLARAYGPSLGPWVTAGAFLGGMAVTSLIDLAVPEHENPHEAHEMSEAAPDGKSDGLMRLGVLSAVAIAIHNFPEGLATFAVALTDVKVGVTIAVAVAIHNIPEGISVAAPVYYATGSRKKAFWYSFLSGLSEPVGALLGYLVLRPFLSDALFGVLFASVAGIMVFISLDELLPAAKKYGTGHHSVYGLIVGMAVMAASLLLGR